MHLADELGGLATYGVSAIAGLLLVSFFADGRAGQGWNGIGLTGYDGVDGQGVSGIAVASGFAADWPGQFQAQLLGAGAIIIWTLLLSFLLFHTVKVVANTWANTGLELAVPSPQGPVPAAETGAPDPDDSEPNRAAGEPQIDARG